MKQTYSFSGLNDWACPLRGKMKRIRRLQEPDNPIRKVGEVVADVMADYRRTCWDNRIQSDFDWFIKRMNAEIRLIADESIAADLYFILDRIRDSDFLILDPNAKKPYIEQMIAFSRSFKRFGFEDPNRGKWFKQAFFRVRPDVIYVTTDNIAVVIDDKATFRTDADPFQLRLGAYAAARIYPRATRIIVLFQYLRFGIRVREEYEPGDLLESVPAEIVERVVRVEDIIKRQAFVPDPDAGVCWFCGFVRGPWLKNNQPTNIGGCPAMGKLLIESDNIIKLCKLPEITDESTAKAAARIARVMEIYSDLIKDRLREYVVKHPDRRIQAAGVEARFNVRERYEVPDVREFVGWLNRNYGLEAAEVWPLLKTNKTALEATLAPEVIADAIDAGHIIVRPSTDFRLYKL